MGNAPGILVTGFEPFGTHAVNPSEHLCKALDGRWINGCKIRGAVLPVHHAHARAKIAALLDELRPTVVLNLGLAAGRARLGLERVAVNVMDYPIPDNEGEQILDEPCIPGGPAAYLSTLPLTTILAALTREGIPAVVSNSAGTYLCNQTMYATLHALAERNVPARAGLIHLPSLPAMVAARGLDEPSMDFAIMLRAVEVALDVLAATTPGCHLDATP
jgi:pyroglutamyl-peptidase